MAEGERRGPARRALIAGGVVAAAGTAVPLVAGAVGGDSGPEPGTTRAPRRTAAPAAATRRPRSDDRPNILLVLTDDQPKETDWALGRTVDWLGGNGVTFERAHANTPLCAPSRASVMTGRYAHHHGVLDTRHPYHLDQRTTVQRRLREAGYRTGSVSYTDVYKRQQRHRPRDPRLQHDRHQGPRAGLHGGVPHRQAPLVRVRGHPLGP